MDGVVGAQVEPLGDVARGLGEAGMDLHDRERLEGASELALRARMLSGIESPRTGRGGERAACLRVGDRVVQLAQQELAFQASTPGGALDEAAGRPQKSRSRSEYLGRMWTGVDGRTCAFTYHRG